MNLFNCQIAEHNSSIISICIKAGCSNSSQCCFKCMQQYHMGHTAKRDFLDIQDAYNRCVEYNERKDLFEKSYQLIDECQEVLDQIRKQLRILSEIDLKSIEAICKFVRRRKDDIEQIVTQIQNNIKENIINMQYDLEELKKENLGQEYGNTQNNEQNQYIEKTQYVGQTQFVGQSEIAQEQDEMQQISQEENDFSTIIDQQELYEHQSVIRNVAISKQNTHIASVDGENLNVWEMEYQKVIFNWKINTQESICLDFAYANNILGVAYYKYIYILDFKNKKDPQRFVCHTNTITAIKFSTTNYLISVSLDQQIVILNIANSCVIKKIKETSFLSSIRISEYQKFILISSEPNVMLFDSVKLSQLKKKIEFPPFGKDSKSAIKIAFSGEVNIITADKKVYIFEISQLLKGALTPSKIFGRSPNLYSSLFCFDQIVILSQSEDVIISNLTLNTLKVLKFTSSAKLSLTKKYLILKLIFYSRLFIRLIMQNLFQFYFFSYLKYFFNQLKNQDTQLPYPQGKGIRLNHNNLLGLQQLVICSTQCQLKINRFQYYKIYS